MGDPKAASVRKVQNPHNLDLGLFLGPLGMPGLTAWSGLHKIGKPQKGETIFVSSAAGAVGQVVGQIAKREGLTVIGSVGSDEKLEFIKQLGYDGGFNYKKESPFDALKRLAPNGIDIYFENVGGSHLEAALENINENGRIPVCGMIESYNTPREEQTDYAKEHQEKMQAWFADGFIQAKLHVTDGIDKAAEGFVELFEGKNYGKALVKIR